MGTGLCLKHSGAGSRSTLGLEQCVAEGLQHFLMVCFGHSLVSTTQFCGLEQNVCYLTHAKEILAQSLQSPSLHLTQGAILSTLLCFRQAHHCCSSYPVLYCGPGVSICLYRVIQKPSV